MDKKVNVLEKLQLVSEREVKRKEQAVKYLEKLTEILAPALREIIGEGLRDVKTITILKWDKEKDGYSYNDLYFRHTRHEIQSGTEYPGFYIDEKGYHLWGKDLTEVKGNEFWQRTKEVTDWISNYLPEYVDKLEKSRDKRYNQLKKLTSVLERGE